jgi:hypothetical protein
LFNDCIFCFEGIKSYYRNYEKVFKRYYFTKITKEGLYMDTIRYVYWQDGGYWLGYIDEYPDYMTQGLSSEEFKENLIDLYKDLTSGEIPCVRRVGELKVA